MATRQKDHDLIIENLAKIAAVIRENEGRLRTHELITRACHGDNPIMAEQTLYKYLRYIDTNDDFNLIRRITQMQGGMKIAWYTTDKEHERNREIEIERIQAMRETNAIFDDLYVRLLDVYHDLNAYKKAVAILSLYDMLRHTERAIEFYRDAYFAPRPFFRKEWDTFQDAIVKKSKLVHRLAKNDDGNNVYDVLNLQRSLISNDWKLGRHFLESHVFEEHKKRKKARMN